MSHEGIKILTESESEAAAARNEAMQRQLPTAAVTPAKVRVKKTEGTGVEIDWHDGHTSSWNFAFLRDACPCATCHDEREKSGRLPGEPLPAPVSLLPMYVPPARPLEATPVGKYALRFKWTDGHESGVAQ